MFLKIVPFFYLFIVNTIEISVIKMPKEFTPGKPHVILFTIENKSDESINPKVNLKLPVGWVAITQPTIGKIEAGQTTRLLYTISVPNNTASGTDIVTIELVEATKILAEKKN